ncbi:MAG: pyridoxamine 5'-phosphate oxidase, partial [Marivirga sp.]|nr:pyridoxamine 5'-phosphate oxidase [Marivirga sp.]
YSSLAFSDASKALQQKAGSRANYSRMDNESSTDEGLTDNELEFIASRDSFYMATVGENGFPYIQFRGGPPGFLRPLDKSRLAFIDFRGNMQYISAGNLVTNNKVALILLDFPSKTRLKLFAEAETIELKNNPELFKKLDLTDYSFRPERIMLLNVKAFNWNCPQHITPRYTLQEIEAAFSQQQACIKKLEEEINVLKLRLAKAY